MSADAADEVEAFVEKNIAGAPPMPGGDDKAGRKRADRAGKDAAAARKELASGGVNVKRLDALAKARAEDRKARQYEDHRRAIDDSTAIGRWLSEKTPVLPAEPDTYNYIVDRVTFIRSFADAGVVTDSHIGSLDSWATYRMQASGDAIGKSGTGRLSFFTLWHNPRTDPIVATVGSRLWVSAYLSVDADWNGVAAWFIGGSDARATVRARTTVHAMWDPSVQAIVSDLILGSAGATGGFFGGDDSTLLAFNQFIPGTGFFVPAQQSILIEVSLITEYHATSGSIDLDATSGAFKVSVPHHIVTVT
jgi:hypothetical protein